jgi:hypothetical protein
LLLRRTLAFKPAQNHCVGENVRPGIEFLKPEQLIDGYEKAISNGFRLLQAAMSLTPEFPEIALGLAEIGQEEIGKSLSLLAAFSLGRDQSW